MAIAQELLAAARRVTVLTGAGISTDSGIPDFRGPNGVWTKNPAAEKASTLANYLGDPEVRRAAWRSRVANPAWRAQPNAGHRAITDLDRRGLLHLLVTQNVDGLHHLAGTAAERIVEIHGTMRRFRCWDCRAVGPMEEALERVRAGEDDPSCLACGGTLKSDTILFGENLVADDLRRAEIAATECDLLLAVGSSLSVYPAAGLVPIAKRRGAAVVIVNGEPTDMDALADALLLGPIGELLPALVGEQSGLA